MLADQFYPTGGGAEQQALRLSLKLVDKGHEVTVLTRKSKSGLLEDEDLEGVHIHRLPVPGFSGSSKLKSTLPATKWLIQNRNDYDIVHCHGVNPLEWSALIAGFITKKPFVVKIALSNFLNYAGAKDGFKMKPKNKVGISSSIIRPLFHPALKFIRKRLIQKAHSVFSISPEISSNLNAVGHHNIVNIPNGIDIDEFSPVSIEGKNALRRKLNLPDDGILFIYSGRLTIEKNIKTLLLAWEMSANVADLPKIQLIILGDGRAQVYSTEEELTSHAIKRRLKTVFFKGTVQNVKEYLQAGDVFVLPSLWEGMSNSLLEAMACGLPAIASDVPGNQALIDKDASGLLFDTNSPQELASCIQRLAQNTNTRLAMGRQAREIAQNRFSLSRITENIICEYQNILAEDAKA